jgi:hypothetical protein
MPMLSIYKHKGWPRSGWPLGLDWFGRLLAAALPDDCGQARAKWDRFGIAIPQFARAEGACNINFSIGSQVDGLKTPISHLWLNL